MARKKEIKKVIEAIDDVSTERVIKKPVLDMAALFREQQDNAMKLLANSIIESIKEEAQDTFKSEAAQLVAPVYKAINDLKKSIDDDTSLVDGLEFTAQEIDTIYESIQALEDEIDEALRGVTKDTDTLGASLVELSAKIDGIAGTVSKDFLSRLEEVHKKHKAFDETIESIHKNYGTHSERFDIVDKHFLKLEKDLKKYASQIYEYGSTFSILNNGTLVGMTNGLNFKAGSNVTITTSVNSQGIVTATIASSGGGGGSSPQVPTGTVNGTNTVFTAATTPTIVFTEGGSFTNGFGVTISGLTITFTSGLQPQKWIYYI